MTPEKWQSTKERIEENFKNSTVRREALDEPGSEVEIVEFDGPLGLMRLEYFTRPAVIGKQVSGSRRIGSHHEVELIYSPTELSHALVICRWDDQSSDWVKMDQAENFSI